MPVSRMKSDLYERDFYAWAHEQAALLRAGRLSDADIENIAEEIESMGKGEKRELLSRLTVLLAHLLKWRHQPERRSTSWRLTIRIQRRDIADHLGDNPSLKALLPAAIARVYDSARLSAAAETDLPLPAFPETCPWSLDHILSEDFWPEA
ncbi:DUF29 domain-containing protein [Zavarzinia compransoris]|uniref:DUF29 domain-containing protein n=1 Tax=Zavarzinia compransoris TaxID=1264899 RepID=A0A317DY10_9PROT|nr:DUF29 domain-containing protein [Zavarzinia compransoris]PWR17725.1 DUF29 domain-containing protein [Zavarzinia compransoris]TDP49248.1 uncharacterized protein DUF29 [Zavarzinia compransoris]